MTIQILGPGCRRCEALDQTTRTAVEQLGLDTSIEKITDYAEMARMGVMSTPALALDGRVVMSGSVPSVERVRELLTAEAP
jgi:small redox-active disulfide protein 2